MADTLINIANAQIDANASELQGKTISRPVLFTGDQQSNRMYVVNVDLGDDQFLYDVAIASGNNELLYAEVGAPVTVTRVGNRWTVTGFSKTMPGTYIRVPVTVPAFDFGLPEYTLGTPIDLTTVIRPLAYDELETQGGYGVVPYGALARIVDGQIVEIFV